MINKIFISLLICVLIFCSSCQKDVSEEIKDIKDSTGVWVLAYKKVNGYDSNFGRTPFFTGAGYTYDTVARTIIYTDTTTFEGHNPEIRQDRMTYDGEGRLIQVFTDFGAQDILERNLFYGQDGLLEKIVLHDRQVSMLWTTQGANKVVQSIDPTDNSGPFSYYNHTFTLDEDGRLVKMVSHSVDTAYGDTHEEVVRGSSGGVLVCKHYSLKNNVREIMDSVIYTREEVRKPRLSRFYELLGNGIQWYTNAYGILYIEPPSLYSEYYEYETNLCNKSTHYSTYIENGQPVTYNYDIDFTTEYDTNDNPTKQTVYFMGDKIAEIYFTWQKINWIN